MIRFLKHTADIKFRAVGKSEEEVFEEAVRAFSQYVSGVKKVKPDIKKKLFVGGSDRCELLYKLVDELIFLLDSEGFLVSQAKVKFTKEGLDVLLEGDKAKNYEISQVKAATYAEMYIKKVKNKWRAQVVLDV